MARTKTKTIEINTENDHENDVLSKIIAVETRGAGAYLLGALAVLDAIRDNGGAGALQAAAASTATTATIDDESDETLADISTAIAKARGVNGFDKVRAMIARRIWEPQMRRELLDRFAAAIVLRIITPEISKSILTALDEFTKKTPGFKRYPFVASRLKPAYRAAGFNWSSMPADFEPAPKKIPFEQTPVGRVIARIEKGE